MAINELFQKYSKAVASADKVLNSDFKSSQSLETQDDLGDANGSVNQNFKNSVTSKLNKEQSNQVDEIVERLKKDLKAGSSQNQFFQERLSSNEETKTFQNVPEVLLDEVSKYKQETSKQKINSEKPEQQNSAKETQLSQSVLFSYNGNHEDQKFQKAESSALQLDEKQTRLEIEKELRSFNISDFCVSENGSFIDPSKYYKFLALRERAGGLGMASEFNKMEATIEFIKYQELEKAIRRPSYEVSQEDQKFYDDRNKSTNSVIKEDLRELLESFTKLRDSLAVAISSGAVKIIKSAIEDINEMVLQKDGDEKGSKKEITSYMIEDSTKPEAQEFVKNLENVVTKLGEFGFQTKTETKGDSIYYEAQLPSNYKGDVSLNEINLKEIENLISNPNKEKENLVSNSNIKEELSKKEPPKLRIIIGRNIDKIKELAEEVKKNNDVNNQNLPKSNSEENSSEVNKKVEKIKMADVVLEAIKKKKSEQQDENYAKVNNQNLPKSNSEDESKTEKSKESVSRISEEIAGRFTQMILKQRQAKQNDQQMGG